MRPTLILNPADDEGFSAAARAIADEGISNPAELERRLRLAYPRATVHARELAAEPILIWYVYREGRWVPPRP